MYVHFYRTLSQCYIVPPEAQVNKSDELDVDAYFEGWSDDSEHDRDESVLLHASWIFFNFIRIISKSV